MKKRLPDEFSYKDFEYIRDNSAKIEWDIFPLDKQLPVSSVWRIFKDEYAKALKVNKGFSGNKYKRLREGYFALFAAVAKSQLEQREHYVLFPKNPNCDAELISVKEERTNHTPLCWYYPCDVKEYTEHSSSFLNFLNEKVTPRLELENYNIVIGINETVTDIQESIEHLLSHTNKYAVWFVYKATEDDNDIGRQRVTLLSGEQFWQVDVDLNTDIPQIPDGHAPLIFVNPLKRIPSQS